MYVICCLIFSIEEHHMNNNEITIYSQFGEDAIILKLLECLSIDKPNYLDIGAHHPISDSNTYLLYRKGARGVLVEANPELIEEIIRARPEDNVINIGIVDNKKSSMPFYILNIKGCSTFSKEYADNAVNNNYAQIIKVINIKTKNINSIMKKYFKKKTPDFLSIDIENYDLVVLKSLDLKKYRPKIICIEVSSKEKTREYMSNNSYILWGCTYANDIYISKECFSILAKKFGWEGVKKIV